MSRKDYSKEIIKDICKDGYRMAEEEIQYTSYAWVLWAL